MSSTHAPQQAGCLVILSGPSGVGKDTVIDAWSAVDSRVRRVVAYTTRQPRAGEVDGVAYHFVSRAEFQKIAEAGGFLEHKEVHGNWYGTPIKETDDLLRDSKIAVLKIDVQGAMDVMNARPDVTSIFLLPPSEDDLVDRITSRGSDCEDVIAKRLENAKIEASFASKYQYCIVNDDVATVILKLQEIMLKEQG